MRTFFTLILGLSAFLAATRGEAQSYGSQLATPVLFAASISEGETIGSEQVRRVKISVGTNEFCFVVPRGFNLRVNASYPDKITISSKDDSYFVTLRFIQCSAETVDLTSYSKSVLLAQYAGTDCLQESSMSADGNAGPAFDAVCYVGGTVRRTLRAAFIPTKVGTMQVTMMADPQKAADGKSVMNTMLITLRSNKDGKLENLVLTDKS